jgi:hypothetical protein
MDNFLSIYRPTRKQRPQKEEPAPVRRFFSGKFTLCFLNSGYTRLISQESRGIDDAVVISKIWGWDNEVSYDDDQEYLLFSVDAELPSSPLSTTNNGTILAPSLTKFYFQARQERQADKSLRYSDGTITIKQDVVGTTSSLPFWGFLSPRGILAQFTRVGDFIMTPTETNSNAIDAGDSGSVG